MFPAFPDHWCLKGLTLRSTPFEQLAGGKFYTGRSRYNVQVEIENAPWNAVYLKRATNALRGNGQTLALRKHCQD
jgi:hypothetical protein